MPDDKETLKILQEQASKPEKEDKGEPIISPKIVEENVKKEGKVWKNENSESDEESSS